MPNTNENTVSPYEIREVYPSDPRYCEGCMFYMVPNLWEDSTDCSLRKHLIDTRLVNCTKHIYQLFHKASDMPLTPVQMKAFYDQHKREHQ